MTKEYVEGGIEWECGWKEVGLVLEGSEYPVMNVGFYFKGSKWGEGIKRFTLASVEENPWKGGRQEAKTSRKVAEFMQQKKLPETYEMEATPPSCFFLCLFRALGVLLHRNVFFSFF